MKYEPVFGDQGLFDDASEYAEIAAKFAEGIAFFPKQKMISSVFFTSGVSLAMRRIIKEPKRWTVEDQKAGRLPDVGSKAVSVRGFCVVDILAVRNGCVVACNSDVMDSRPCVFTIDNFLELYKPIETPEEKERRARKEWCNRAMDYSTIQELYDAMLSGELTMPNKDGE